MKRKYQGITVAGLALAVVAAFSIYAGSGMWQKADAVPKMRHQPVTHIKVPTQIQVQQMDRLYDRMPMLAVPSKREVAAKKLSLFGYRSPVPAMAADRGEAGDGLDQSGFQLSLVVQAGFGNFCIVDGKFIAEGTQMDDGTKVLKIESHRVLIARNTERKWIYLDKDGQPSSTPTVKASSDRPGGQT